MLGRAVQFLASDVLVDFRGTFPVRPVGAPEVPGVGHADGTVFLAVPPEVAGPGIFPAGAAIETTGRAVLAVTTAGPVATIGPFTERLPVLSPAKATTLTLAITARTVTKGPVLTVAIRLAVTIAKRLPVTIARRLTLPGTERLPLPGTETTTLTLALTARTVTKGPVLTVAIRLAVTVPKRLTLPGTERLTLTLALTARTVTKRLLVTVPKRLTLASTERLPLPGTESTTLTLAITARTVTKRLLVTVPKRLTLTAAGGTAGITVVAAAAGTESTRVAA
ncbi:hypothetical protein [Arthrobacter sp. PGP41]|uniref:hypothetical protein n=1 Tax=Arthrobacter sp. PGP41 TaxID=2079227 RepID=UPI001F20E0C9|nr:hypothetical protein [Arthrobacter sp. PGP41]